MIFCSSTESKSLASKNRDKKVKKGTAPFFKKGAVPFFNGRGIREGFDQRDGICSKRRNEAPAPRQKEVPGIA